MHRLIASIFIGLIFVAPGMAQAVSPQVIAVLAVERDKDSLPVASSLSNDIGWVIKQELLRNQFNVVDESALPNSRQTDGSATVERQLALASETTPRPDIIVLAESRVRIIQERVASSGVIAIQLTAYNGTDHRVIATSEYKSEPFIIRTACYAECFRVPAEDAVRIAFFELRPQLSAHAEVGSSGASIGVPGVGSHPSGGLVTTYRIRFENLRMAELQKIKRVMESEFPEFIRASNMAGVEPVVGWEYISRAPKEKIIEWLLITLDDLQINDAKIASEGASVTVVCQDANQCSPPTNDRGKFR